MIDDAVDGIRGIADVLVNVSPEPAAVPPRADRAPEVSWPRSSPGSCNANPPPVLKIAACLGRKALSARAQAATVSTSRWTSGRVTPGDDGVGVGAGLLTGPVVLHRLASYRRRQLGGVVEGEREDLGAEDAGVVLFGVGLCGGLKELFEVFARGKNQHTAAPGPSPTTTRSSAWTSPPSGWNCPTT